jgi:uncharacterized UBP type Zn finger protein
MDPRLARLREQILSLGRVGRLKHVVRYAIDAVHDSSATADDVNAPRAKTSTTRIVHAKAADDSDSDDDEGSAAATVRVPTSRDSGIDALISEAVDRLKAVLAADFP